MPAIRTKTKGGGVTEAGSPFTVGGTAVGYFDSNGHLYIKGDILTNETV